MSSNYSAILFLFFSLVSCTYSSANTLDSLYKALYQASDPEQRWAIHQDLGELYHEDQFNSDSSRFHLRKAIQIATHNNFIKRRAVSYAELGRLFSDTNYPNQQFIQLLDTAITANRTCQECPKGLMHLLTIKGLVYQDMGLKEEALVLFNECLVLAQEQQDPSQIVALYNSIAGCYNEELASGAAKALLYYQRGLEIVDTLNWPLARSVLLNNIADIYIEQKKYEEAEEYFTEAISIKRQLKNENKLSVSLCQIAVLYVKTNRWELALNHAQEGLALARKTKTNNGISICLESMAQVAHNRGEYDTEITYAKEGLALQTDNASLFEYDLYYFEHLYNAFQQKQQYDSAFYYLQAYQHLSDTLQKIQSSKKIEELVIGFDLQEAEFRNELLQEKQEKSDLLLERRQIIIYLIIFIAAALLASVLWWNRKKERLNRQLDQLVKEKTERLETVVADLQEANEELSYFTYITSHDLKEPLRNIHSFTTLLERKLKGTLDADKADLLGNIKKSAKQMNNLIEDVMQYALVNKKAIKTETFELKEIIELVQEDLKALIAQKNGHILYEGQLTLHTSKTAVRVVFNNLFKNALEYNDSSPPIAWVKTETTPTELIIHIKDNGIGIDPMFHEQVFVMFKRLHSRATHQGTGLGLSISQRMINKMGGTIHLDSQKGNGATFSLHLPLDVFVEPSK